MAKPFVISVLGARGTGKTLVSQSLVATLRAQGHTVNYYPEGPHHRDPSSCRLVGSPDYEVHDGKLSAGSDQIITLTNMKELPYARQA